MTCELGFVYFLSDLVVWPATPPGHPITQIYFPKNVSASNPGPASKKKNERKKEIGQSDWENNRKNKKKRKRVCTWMCTVHVSFLFCFFFFGWAWWRLLPGFVWDCIVRHTGAYTSCKKTVWEELKTEMYCAADTVTHTHTHTHREGHISSPSAWRQDKTRETQLPM